MWSTSQNAHTLTFLADQITLITFWSCQVFSKLSITYWVQQEQSTYSKEIPENRPSVNNTHLVTEICQWRSALELHWKRPFQVFLTRNAALKLQNMDWYFPMQTYWIHFPIAYPILGSLKPSRSRKFTEIMQTIIYCKLP